MADTDIKLIIKAKDEATAAINGVFNHLNAEAKKVWEQTRTPLERYEQEVSKLGNLLKRAAISQDTYNRALSQARERFKGASNEARNLSDKSSEVGESILLMASSLKGISVAAVIATAIASLRQLGEIAVENENAVFQMRETFGSNTDAMIAKARELSEHAKKYYDFTEVSYSFVKTADSMERYGITGDKYIGLVTRAMDVGASKGLELKDSIDRIESAMRGEAEASEYLGVTLNDTYMKNKAFNGALKNTWETLTDNQKAFYRHNELMRQTEKYKGAAARATDTFTGSVKSLANTLKDQLGPELSKVSSLMAKFINTVTQNLKPPELADKITTLRAQLEDIDRRKATIQSAAPSSWYGPDALEQKQAIDAKLLAELDSRRQQIQMELRDLYRMQSSEGMRRQTSSSTSEGQLPEMSEDLANEQRTLDLEKTRDELNATKKAAIEYAEAMIRYNDQLYQHMQGKPGISRDEYNELSQAAAKKYQDAIAKESKDAQSEQKKQAKAAEETANAQTELTQSQSKERLAAIERESDALEQSYKAGTVGASQYYTELKRLASASAEERIAELEREKALAEAVAGAQLSEPEANKAAIETNLQAKIQALNTEIENQRNGLTTSITMLNEELKKTSAERLDAEVSTLQTLTQQEGLTADQRRQINQQYLEVRTQQIDQEAEELKQKGVDAVTVDKWKTAEIKAEQEKLAQYNLAQLQRMLTDEATTAEEREKIWQQVRERIEAGEVNTWDAFKLGWRDTAEHFNKSAQDMMEIGKTTATGLRDGFKNLFVGVVKGDFDGLNNWFDSFSDSLIDKWSEMLSNMLMDWLGFSDMLKNTSDSSGSSGSSSLWGSLGNFFSGLFSDGSSNGGAIVSSTSSSSSNGWAIVAHSGGAVGSSAFQSRMVIPSIFAHAPRLHSGLASDEFPAILQAGEEVRSRSQVASDRKASGVNMQVNIHEAPGTKATVEQDDSGNLNVIIEQLEQAMSSRMSRGAGLSSYFDSRYTRRR